MNEGRAVNPHLSVDCVIFGFDFEKLNVLLVDRKLTNEKGNLVADKTLAGNHVFMDEDLDEAAARVLKDLTGLSDIYLEQFKTFGNPNRLLSDKDQKWIKSIGYNPTDRVVTVGYFSLVNVFAAEFDLRNAEQNPKWYGRNPQWYPIDGKYDLCAND
jgi:ADP-ribose pyrophosphatase YjhB (NUDIX family)